MISLISSYKAPLPPTKQTSALNDLKRQLSVRFSGGGTGTGTDNNNDNDSGADKANESTNYLDKFVYQGSLDSKGDVDQTPQQEVSEAQEPEPESLTVDDSKSTFEPGKKWKRRERRLAEKLFDDIKTGKFTDAIKKLEKGVRLDYVDDETGYNFLTRAMVDPSPEMIAALLKTGMDVDTVDAKKRTLVTMMLNNPDLPTGIANLIFSYKPKALSRSLKDQHGLNMLMEQSRTDVFKKMLDAGSRLDLPSLSDDVLANLSEPPLISAILQNKPLELDLMLTHQTRPDLNIRGHEFMTPLHATAMVNSTRMAEKFLARGADLDVFDEDGDSPFHQAVISAIEEHQDPSELLDLMVAHQPDHIALVDQKNTLDGNTALHQVFLEPTRPMESDSVDPIVDLKIKLAVRLANKLITDFDADINAKNDNGETPLMLALDKGMWDGVDLLLANPSLDLSVADKNGRTALERFELKTGCKMIDLVAFAASSDEAMFARLKKLDELGLNASNLSAARIPKRTDEQLGAIRRLFKHETLPKSVLENTTMNSGPVYTAMTNKNYDVAKWLLEKISETNSDGLDVVYVGGDKPANLLSLVALDRSAEALEMAEFLLDKGVSPLRPSMFSALSQAVQAANLSVVKLFVDKLDTSIDTTPLGNAPVFNDFFNTKFVHDVGVKDEEGNPVKTPIAMSYGVLSYLAENVKDMNALDTFGKHPLMYAFEKSDWTAFNILLDHGADLSAPAGDDKTVLDLIQKHAYDNNIAGEPISLTEVLVSAKQIDLAKRLIKEQDLLNLNSTEMLSMMDKPVRDKLKPELLKHHSKLYVGKSGETISDGTNLMKELIDTNSDVTDWVKKEPQLLNEQQAAQSYISSLEYALKPETLRSFHTLIKAGASVGVQSHVTGNNIFHSLPYLLDSLMTQSRNSASKSIFDRLNDQLENDLEINPLNVPNKENKTPFESLLAEACVFGDDTLQKGHITAFLTKYMAHGAELRPSFIRQTESIAKETLGQYDIDTNIIAMIESHGYPGMAEMLLHKYNEPELLNSISHNTLISLLKSNQLDLFSLILKKAKEQNNTPVLNMIKENAGELLLACLADSGDVATSALKILIAFEPDLINAELVQAPFLLETARNEKYNLAQFAINNNADVSAKSKKGYSLLFILINNLRKDKAQKVMMMSLIDRVLKKEPSLLNEVNPNGHTPLMSAVQAQDLDVVKKLVKAGSDLTAVTSKGNSLKDFVDRFDAEESGIGAYLESKYPNDIDAQIALKKAALEEEDAPLNRPDGRPTEKGRAAAIEALKKAQKNLDK